MSNLYRLRGGEWEPSYYGTFLLYLSPLYIIYFLKENYIYNKQFHIFSLIILSINMIFSFSSSTWLLLPPSIIIITIFILKYIKEKTLHLSTIFLIIFSLLFFTIIGFYISGKIKFIFQVISKFLFPTQSSSGLSRINSITYSLNVFWDNPLLGSGGFIQTGNLYSEVLSQYGIIGFFIIIYIFFFLYKINFKYNNYIKNNILFTNSIALGCSFLIMLLTMTINNNFFRINYFFIFAFILANYKLKRHELIIRFSNSSQNNMYHY